VDGPPASKHTMGSLPTILMLPPVGNSPAEQWVAAGRLASASDLVERLQQVGSFDPIYALAADSKQRSALVALGVDALEPVMTDFHFGQVLNDIIQEKNLKQLAYFGGASAPLLTAMHLQTLFEELRIATETKAIVNNIYSSDWFLLNEAALLAGIADRLPADNPVGYVLSHDLGVDVQGMHPEAASRLDIDTPTDLAMLHTHPALGRHLEQFLAAEVGDTLDRVEKIARLLDTPASTLAVIGRCSSQVWQTLERSTQIWIRMFVEERGMVASRRLEHGEVRSLVGEMVNLLGPRAFLDRINTISDGLLWDTRVWMGMGRAWPSPADRFASDLGQADQIEDQALRELTRAALEADFPILLGGYGVVSGGIYALLESMPARSPAI
jgi:hypothetical protein